MATQADFLEWFQRTAREIQTPTNTSKRATRNKVERRKGHRMVSPRQRAALKMTSNPVRAAYQSAEQADRQWQGIAPANPNILTRNVGPSDLPRSTSGKQTIGERPY